MKYQNILNLLGHTPNQPSIFETKNCVEIRDESRETYNEDNQIRFQTSMVRSRLCDYSDAQILVKQTITLERATAAAPNNANKKVIFKNCAPFTKCISRINNTQADDAQYIDVVIPMYNVIEYIDNYSKTSGILWQYCRDKQAVNNMVELLILMQIMILLIHLKLNKK